MGVTLEVELRVFSPAKLSAEKRNPLITGRSLFSIFEDDEGNSEESARSFRDLETRITRLIDEDKHGRSIRGPFSPDHGLIVFAVLGLTLSLPPSWAALLFTKWPSAFSWLL